MSVKLNNYVVAVKKFLQSDTSLGVALTQARPEILAMTPEKRTVWFHTNIAPLVAQAYGCEHYITNQGGTSFKTDEGRHDTALSKFRYVTQTHIIGGESKQVDVVVSLTRSLKKRREEGVSYKQALKALNLAYDKQ
jgi:hypothetical protein